QAVEQPTPSENGAVKASPVARRVAADRGIALDSVPGTGPGGRITKEDVLASADIGQREGDAGAALPDEVADVPALSVAREAALHNIDLDEIAGDRPLSALTRYDVMSAVASREEGQSVTVESKFIAPRAQPGQAAEAAPAPAPQRAAPAQAEKAEA